MTTSSNDTLPVLPNPFTPMAFLPPGLAYQVTVSVYFFVGATGVMIWDVLNNLYGDYLLLFKHRVSGPTVAYFLSRLGSLGFVLASTIYTTTPNGKCAEFEKGLDWMYPVAVACTSLLFFFRVKAVFDGNRYVTGFFAFMWLAVLGGSLTVTQGIVGRPIGPTKYCLNASLAPYLSSAAIIPLVNDTLIFLAITWKLMRNSYQSEYTVKDGLRTLFLGEYLPAFSRAVLQDGQMYYLTTVTSNLLTLIMLYVHAVPVAYRTMFTVPNIVIMNVMGCRVFRNTKLGHSTGESSKGPKEGGIFPLVMRPRRSGNGSRDLQDNTSEIGGGIEVTKTVELHDDYGFQANLNCGHVNRFDGSHHINGMV